MKQITLDALRHDLIKDKKKYESIERFNKFKYEIEYIPVLTERDSDGKLLSVTNPQNGILFKVENNKDDEYITDQEEYKELVKMQNIKELMMWAESIKVKEPSFKEAYIEAREGYVKSLNNTCEYMQKVCKNKY